MELIRQSVPCQRARDGECFTRDRLSVSFWDDEPALRGRCRAQVRTSGDDTSATSRQVGRGRTMEAPECEMVTWMQHGDIVVPSHRTDWGLRSFAVAGPSSWNALPCWFEVFLFWFRYFCKALENTSIWFSVLTTGHALLSMCYIL